MTLSERSAPTWIEKAYRTLTKGVSGAALLAGSAAFTAGCLDRPVTPAVPTTNNVYIDQIRQTGVDKIDLLFMIDNSISMADKQQILAAAVPVLVNRLIAPICLDANDMPTGASSPCPNGQSPEFKAIEDIHIGVITSSIGDHGSADVCSEGSTMNANATYNDKGQFVPTVYTNLPNRMGLQSYNGQGFLVWDPRMPGGGIMPHNPPGFSNATQFIDAFTDHVTATGENGCGYEAQLESWYRFLVDPEPVDSMTNDGRVSVRGAVNQTVLAQRAAFLRPDSLLAIIMLTDENDCSIVDEAGTQGWLIPFKGGPNANSWRMPRAHAICQTNPNDPGCAPCGNGDPDPGCMGGAPYTPAEDAPNVRCFRQKQRFGIDLLYPTQRYVDGLKSIQIDPRYNGTLVENPIYKPAGAGAPPRDGGLVFLAGIVGVPWQDIATPETLNDPRALVYMNSEELADRARWPVILGEPYNAVEPLDPFMIEAIDPRPTGLTNPILPAEAILPPDSTAMNRINGHEQAVIAAERADLQFACIFPLAAPYDCNAMNEGGCDCNADEFPKSSPLCTYPGGAGMDGRQERAKAYPGLRELQVLKDVGSNAIVASICPKNIQPANGASMTTDPNYGYNPAVSAIVERLKEALTAKCLPRPLLPEDNPQSSEFGKVPCAVVETRPMIDMQPCPVCDPAAGRLPLEGEKTKIIPAVQEHLFNNAFCGGTDQRSCSEYCMCELEQFTGAELDTCVQSAMDPGGLFGYCYVDANVPGYNPALLANCADTEQRILRFMGNNVPAKDGLAFIACIGEAASSDPVMPVMP